GCGIPDIVSWQSCSLTSSTRRDAPVPAVTTVRSGLRSLTSAGTAADCVSGCFSVRVQPSYSTLQKGSLPLARKGVTIAPAGAQVGQATPCQVSMACSPLFQYSVSEFPGAV